MNGGMRSRSVAQRLLSSGASYSNGFPASSLYFHTGRITCSQSPCLHLKFVIPHDACTSYLTPNNHRAYSPHELLIVKISHRGELKHVRYHVYMHTRSPVSYAAIAKTCTAAAHCTGVITTRMVPSRPEWAFIWGNRPQTDAGQARASAQRLCLLLARWDDAKTGSCPVPSTQSLVRPRQLIADADDIRTQQLSSPVRRVPHDYPSR